MIIPISIYVLVDEIFRELRLSPVSVNYFTLRRKSVLAWKAKIHVHDVFQLLEILPRLRPLHGCHGIFCDMQK
jgi:hypothetical protein